MASVMQDLRHAIRTLAAHPGYLATALLTLALGIGFSTATFSVIDAVLLRPLPFHDPDQILLLRERRLPQFPSFSVAPGNYLAWRDEATVFDGIAAFGSRAVSLQTGSGDPDRVRIDRVTANLFGLLGGQPVLGRTFTQAEDADKGPRVAILSWGAWQRRFGGRTDIVGQTVRLDREPVTIVGVMPESFVFPSRQTELWIPMAFEPEERTLHGSHYLAAIARMKPGVTVDRARADLAAIAKRLEQTYPDSNRGWDVLADPLQDYMVRDVRTPLLVLLGAVALVLLIACVNVANLLLARGASRARELAIRSALGAARWRLVRQLLVETVVLSTAAAALGLVIASWGLQGLLALQPDALPRQADIGLNPAVLAVAVALVIVTPILFGLLPALQASRTDVRELLAAGGRQGSVASARRTRTALVVAELALAMILLVGAGLLMRSFARLSDVSPGFDPSGTLIAGITLPETAYPDDNARERVIDQFLARVRELPRVDAAAITQSVPLLNDHVASLDFEGRPAASPTERPTTNFYAVTPGFFAAMRIPLIRGRAITDADRQGAQRVVVINQTLAERDFAGEDPIGRRIRVSQGDDAWRTIIGIVGDTKQYGVMERTPAQVYEPYRQHRYFGAVSAIVRVTDGDPASLAPDLRSIMRSIDPQLPLARVRSMQDVLSESVGPQRFSAVLIALFGAAALLLAAIGLYGVMAYLVGQRTQEFAIRIAHGATRTAILRLVLVNGAATVLIGTAIGVVGALLLRRLLAGLLFGVSATDPLTYAAVAIVLVGVALAASLVPALRATRVDPIVALRAE